MAALPFSLSPTINDNHRHRRRRHQQGCPLPPISNSTTMSTNSMDLSFPSSSSYKISLYRSFPVKGNSWSGRCHATSPPSEPPPEKHMTPPSGSTATFTRFQDTLQIFFAVLFWMSLFFWSSAWDGGNRSRPNKGSRFRK